LDLDELSIAELQAQLTSGQLIARQLVERHLARIEAVDRSGPTLRSVLETNPDALGIADELDRERSERGPRGPLHGIPILLKDNIETADRMQTTAGSLALVDVPVERDATVAQRLRSAGAVILGKTNLSEWANWRSTRSCSGWSGRGRQTRNPFVLDRSPIGSSSGSAAAVSANLAPSALGTETDGSIVSPSSACGVVGIKPTVGLTSRAGVVPISHTQDTVGAHARSVADAAAVLSALVGEDTRDPATRGGVQAASDYTQFLEPDGLRGAHIGVVRRFLTGYNLHADRILESALDVLRGQGATVSDVAEIPGHTALRENVEGEDVTSEGVVLEYEFKADIGRYLEERIGCPFKSLADLIRFNLDHAAEEMPYFGQERFTASEARGPLSDDLYQRCLAKNRAFAADFAQFLKTEGFDALVAPSTAPAWAIDLLDGDRPLGGSAQAAAVGGFPLVTVPAGFALDLLPVGLTFMGPAWSEPTLIRLAYAFEQASRARRAPSFVPSTLHLP
jgi:amidase